MAPIRPFETGEAGYTLIELLVVMVVIGLLLAATPVLLRAADPGVRDLSAARMLAIDLRATRSAALAQGAETRVVFAPDRQLYSIFPGKIEKRLPYGVGFATADRSGAEIDFFADGSARGGNVMVGRKHRVSVDWLTGQVTVDE